MAWFKNKWKVSPHFLCCVLVLSWNIWIGLMYVLNKWLISSYNSTCLTLELLAFANLKGRTDVSLKENSL